MLKHFILIFLRLHSWPGLLFLAELGFNAQVLLEEEEKEERVKCIKKISDLSARNASSNNNKEPDVKKLNACWR